MAIYFHEWTRDKRKRKKKDSSSITSRQDAHHLPLRRKKKEEEKVMVHWAEMICQFIMWCTSATMMLVLLPYFLLFWTWKSVTDYSSTLKRSKHRADPSRVSLYGGTSRFVQLAVSLLSIMYHDAVRRIQSSLSLSLDLYMYNTGC